MTTDRTEEYLERILKLWAEGNDTGVIATKVGLFESDVYNALARHRDGTTTERHFMYRRSVRQVIRPLIPYAGKEV